MYLHELTREQQHVFLILARQVIDADERLAMQELESLEALYRELDVPPETADAPDVAIDLNFTFDSPRRRAVVFIELLLVAYSDDMVDDSENEALTRIAEAMEISEETRKDAHRWVMRLIDLRRDGKAVGSD